MGRTPGSLEEFIEGALDEKPEAIARKRPNKDNIKLIIAGRMHRKNKTQPQLIYLRNDIKSEIEEYCSGNAQAIFNYLLKVGIEQIKKSEKLIIEEL